MTIKPISECPNPLDGIYNPPDALKYGYGYRVMPPVPVVPDGYTRISITPVDVDGVNGAWQVQDRPDSELAAEARQLDLAENAPRYVLENQYIILCDALRQALGQTPDQTAIHESDFPVMMIGLKRGNEAAYNTLRDAFALVTAKLATYEQKWMDAVCYHPQPELQSASLKILELAQ